MMRNAPWQLYRYLFRELLTIFGMSILSLSLLFMVVLGIKAVQGGYSLRIIMPWILESIAYSFFFTVPLSLLVASTLGYGRFVADREYTAATASGVSPISLMAPMLLLSLILGSIAFLTQGTVLPRAHYKQRNITRYLVKQLEHLGDSKKGKLQIDQEDGLVYWDEIQGGRFLRGVHIEKRLPIGKIDFGSTQDGAVIDGEEDELAELPPPPTFINADTAELSVDSNVEMISLTLYQVDVKYPKVDRGYLFPKSTLPKLYDSFRLSEITVQFPINEKKRREGDLTNSELVQWREECTEKLAHYESLLAEGGTAEGPLSAEEREDAERNRKYFERRIRKSNSQIWFRRALALSVITFGFLGFPISVTFRHTHRMVPFFIGVLLAMGIFYPLLLLGEALVKNQGLPAPLCMLSGSAILIAVALFLTGRLVAR